jgi:hypothetical protein
VGPTVIVAAPVANKKLKNYAFRQQLTSFFKIHCAKRKKPAQLFIFLSLYIANSICCSLSSPNIREHVKDEFLELFHCVENGVALFRPGQVGTNLNVKKKYIFYF